MFELKCIIHKSIFTLKQNSQFVAELLISQYETFVPQPKFKSESCHRKRKKCDWSAAVELSAVVVLL